MICAIYRSPKKLSTYLYVKRRDDFSDVPAELMKTFGRPEFSMLIKLTGERKLAQADIDVVKKALDEKGYYLQLPPPPVNYLEEYKKSKQ